MSRARALVLRSAGTACLVLALLVGRVLYGASAEWSAGEAARTSGDERAAVVHYRDAIAWYVPLSPYGPRAIRALEEVGQRAMATGNIERALAAERALIAGVESARGYFAPYGDALAAARAREQALVARRDPGLRTRGAREPFADPSPFFSTCAALAWLVFAGSSLGLVLVGADASGRFRNQRALWLSAMALSATVFALALWLAG